MKFHPHSFQKKLRLTKQKLIAILIGLLLISMAINIYLIWRNVKNNVDVPNFYVPKRFAFKYPDCANKLIEELGIDNIKIEPVVNRGSNDSS